MTQLELCFAPDGAGRTRLVERRAGYPYSVTAPIMQPGGVAQLTLQSISGGLYGGEHVGQSIKLREGASVHLVQPAATTVRRSAAAGPALQHIRLEAGASARLIYAMRPLIMLPGAILWQDWEIMISASAKLLFWDGFVSHSPNGKRPDWSLVSRVTVHRDNGKRLASERMNVDGSALGIGFQGTPGAFNAFGKFWCLGHPPGGLKLNMILAGLENVSAGITSLPAEAGFTIALAAVDGGALSAAMDSVLKDLEALWA